MSKVAQYINLSSGETLPFSVDADGLYVDQDTDIDMIKKEIENNLASPSFRIFVLCPDETIDYEIPNSAIKTGGSYNENYQDGQRRTLSFVLYNHTGQFNPDINHLWAGTRLRLDQGLKLSSGTTVWFQKGVYVITQITPSLTTSGREVQISASDKFSLFEGATGKLETSYIIETGSVIEDVVRSILSTEMGNGYVLDPQEMIYNSAFKNKVTQAEISKSAGDTLGSILLELGTQLSAEVFYNANGNLVFAPVNEVSMDTNKPLLWEYQTSEGNIGDLDFSLDYSTVVNRVIVIGSSSSGGACQGVAVNGDVRSPLCYQRIGLRTGDIINDSDITTDLLAQERAEYELRQQLIIKTSSSVSVMFNPFLEVNNLIAISDDFFGLARERFLIQSVSCNLDYSGTTNISFSNLNNLAVSAEITVGRETPSIGSGSSIIDNDIKSKVFISGGSGVLSVFLSLDPTATEGCPSGTEFSSGDTVYGFVTINEEGYYPQKEWRSVSGGVYCVSSVSVPEDSLDLGSFGGIQKWETKWASGNKLGDCVKLWGASGTLPEAYDFSSLSSGIGKKDGTLTYVTGHLDTDDLRIKTLFGQNTFFFEGTIEVGGGETTFINRQASTSAASYTVYLQGGGRRSSSALLGYIKAQTKGETVKNSYLPCSLYLTEIKQDTYNAV